MLPFSASWMCYLGHLDLEVIWEMSVNSRRRFLGLLGTIPLISGYLFYSWRPLRDVHIDENLVLVRGWILKKSDLAEGIPYDHRS